VTASEEHVVRAAGGLVLRPAAGGTGTEIALVHRPKYDDWTFPKGKLDPGETDEQAAVREVAEETGLDARLDRELPDVRYRDASGRDKVVRYWTMTPTGGEFRPNREVDELRWVPPDEAATLLTYDHDRALLDELND
jgi:8-oxo-dGTP diphosphatase